MSPPESREVWGGNSQYRLRFPTRRAVLRTVLAPLPGAVLVMAVACSASTSDEGVPSVLPTSSPSGLVRGDPATWTLADPPAVSEASTELKLSVTRVGCANGKTGELMAPQAWADETTIYVRVDAVPITDPAGSVECPSNAPTLTDLDLGEKLGPRRLVDAACFDATVRELAECDSDTRWEPK